MSAHIAGVGSDPWWRGARRRCRGLARSTGGVLLGGIIFCGPVPPPDLQIIEREDSGVVHARLAAPDLRPRNPGQPVGLWLVYPGFDAGPTALGAHRTEVTVPEGRLALCLVTNTATVERAGPHGTGPVTGVLAYLSYEPAVSGTPRYPYDAAFEDARKQNLLTPIQLSRLAALDRVLVDRGRMLAREWDEFRESPYVIESRRRLLQALHGFYDPRPAFEPGALEPARFFDSPQREALRSLGHDIPGRCYIEARESRAVLELRSCPLEQLADTWNRRVADGTLRGPRVGVVTGAGDREVNASFSAEALREGEASRLLLALVTAFAGVETQPSVPSPRSLP